MKRVGIITLYYKNYNYGGLLQSYALCEYLRKQGFDSRQITFNKTGIHRHQKNKLVRLYNLLQEQSPIGAINKIFSKLKVKADSFKVSNKEKKILAEGIKARNSILLEFMDLIPHTNVVDEGNISSLSELFDVFITGSDQVWKPGVCCDEYFLKFTEKQKISYAASIGRTKLAKNDEYYLIDSIQKLNAVSVREEEAFTLLSSKGIKAELVVDPTLLLSREDWSNFGEKYDVDKKYIFCYFLGTSKKHRGFAEKYAKKHNLKIVTLPYLSGIPNSSDVEFGDYKLYDVSPQNFVYLIKNAEYVFTDSFHATVFSGIFGKQFVVFDREEEKTMSGRLINLLDIFGASDRFMNNIDTIEDLSLYGDIYENERFIKLRDLSFSYLRKNC